MDSSLVFCVSEKEVRVILHIFLTCLQRTTSSLHERVRTTEESTLQPLAHSFGFGCVDVRTLFLQLLHAARMRVSAFREVPPCAQGLDEPTPSPHLRSFPGSERRCGPDTDIDRFKRMEACVSKNMQRARTDTTRMKVQIENWEGVRTCDKQIENHESSQEKCETNS